MKDLDRNDRLDIMLHGHIYNDILNLVLQATKIYKKVLIFTSKC